MMVFVFNESGICLARNVVEPLPSEDTFKLVLGNDILFSYHITDPLPTIPYWAVVGTIESGVVVSVDVDPLYVPPEPPVNPLTSYLVTIYNKLDASSNSRTNVTWVAQKELAKTVGVAHIKANPSCTMQDVADAIDVEIAAQFTEPKMIDSLGLAEQYQHNAFADGLIPVDSWVNFRAWVIGASAAEIEAALAKR